MRISDWSSDVCSSDLAHSLQCHAIPRSLGSDRSDDHRHMHARFSRKHRHRDRVRTRGVSAAHAAGASQPSRFSDNLPVLRSEEHTSELQSLMRISYAVFCLKKKKHINKIKKKNHIDIIDEYNNKTKSTKKYMITKYNKSQDTK